MNLLCIGCGYSAKAAARRVLAAGGTVAGTTRAKDGAARLEALGIRPIVFDGTAPAGDLGAAIAEADWILVSIAPDADGDPVLRHHADAIRRSTAGVVYLSTVGVYGDHDGAWVDEDTPPRPVSQRSLWRIAAETAWAALADARPVVVLRLAGIYGPGRGPFAKLKAGTARAVAKPGQVFNRIHVDDIASACLAAMADPAPGFRIYNVSDDEPAPPEEVLFYAADLAGLPRPPLVPYDEAEMSPMARTFYGETKRVRNTRLKDDLGVTLAHPTYREGLKAVIAAETAA